MSSNADQNSTYLFFSFLNNLNKQVLPQEIFFISSLKMYQVNYLIIQLIITSNVNCFNYYTHTQIYRIFVTSSRTPDYI